MKHQESTISIGNDHIFMQSWQQDKVSHVIILVHGFGEHSGRYEGYVVNRLVANGAAVTGFDHVGHGKSSGKRGHCKSYEQLLNTLQLIIKSVKKQFPDQPVFLYGQSLGGNLVLNYALRRQPDLAGIIASSPFLRLAFQPPGWKMTIGKLFLKFAPSITLPLDLETAALSKDELEVHKYEEDPLVHNKVSPNYSFPIMEAGEWAIDNAGLLKVPTLIMHGCKDRIIDYRGSVDFSNNGKLATLQLFKEGYHELHNDIEKEEVLDTVLKWVNSHLKK